MIIYKQVTYSSQKHPVLEYIFSLKNPNKTTSKKTISFTLKDISDGYDSCGIPEPASISNTILDLTRKRTSISSRVPDSISKLGYDLRKKTGPGPGGKNFAGEFVFVGVGNEISSWLEWPKEMKIVSLDSNPLPKKILSFLRNDEGALFSVIDYCDVLSTVLSTKPGVITSVQHPLKWQPNEIDGLYLSEHNGSVILYPVEAKALSTKDDINLEQIQGAVSTIINKFQGKDFSVIPLAMQMIKNGIKLAIFNRFEVSDKEKILELKNAITIQFSPAIAAWK